MRPRILRTEFSNGRLAFAGLTVLLAAIPLSYVAWKHDISPALNVLWIIGIPAIAALSRKRSVLDQFLAAVFFSVCLFLGIGVTAALIGYP
jgi:pheromone shutdown protein TraB